MRKVYADIEVQYTDSQSELRNMQDENEGLKETVTEIKASNTKQSAEIGT